MSTVQRPDLQREATILINLVAEEKLGTLLPLFEPILVELRGRLNAAAMASGGIITIPVAAGISITIINRGG